jgi:thiol-disulfide isomerase/thioredoxin
MIVGRKALAVCLAPAFIALGALQAATVNQPAPKFTLTDSRRQKRTLSDYKGKVVFINFWASWCAPCQEELPALNRLAADYKSKKVQILAINVDEQPASAKTLLTKLGLTRADFEVLWDSKSKAVGAYNIEVMPSSYILDRNGVIRFTHSGFHGQDPIAWRHEIDNLTH